MTSITIGVPTYKGAARVANLLRSIELRTPLDGVRVVLVDDGSPGDEVAETRRVAVEWKGRLPLDFYEHGGNRGISAGWNTASRAPHQYSQTVPNKKLDTDQYDLMISCNSSERAPQAVLAPTQ